MGPKVRPKVLRLAPFTKLPDWDYSVGDIFCEGLPVTNELSGLRRLLELTVARMPILAPQAASLEILFHGGAVPDPISTGPEFPGLNGGGGR
jgi:hypothetical protein